MSDSSLPPADAPAPPPAPLSRVEVGDIAVRLFQTRGYDATTATDIAAAAGVSRSTFFRQFRSKDDVIFADHDELLEQIAVFFSAPHPDPWLAACDAAGMVFERFRERLEIVRIRDLLVRQTQILRDRETVMVSRYEKVFADYLRREVPTVSALTAIRFAAAVTATHNFELRRLIGSNEPVGPQELVAELAEVRRLLQPGARSGEATEPELVVAVFPASASPQAMARAIEEQLRSRPTAAPMRH